MDSFRKISYKVKWRFFVCLAHNSMAINWTWLPDVLVNKSMRQLPGNCGARVGGNLAKLKLFFCKLDGKIWDIFFSWWKHPIKCHGGDQQVASLWTKYRKNSLICSGEFLTFFNNKKICRKFKEFKFNVSIWKTNLSRRMLWKMLQNETFSIFTR